MRRWEDTGEVSDSEDEELVISSRPLQDIDVNIQHGHSNDIWLLSQSTGTQHDEKKIHKPSLKAGESSQTSRRDPRSRTPPTARPARAWLLDNLSSSSASPPPVRHAPHSSSLTPSIISPTGAQPSDTPSHVRTYPGLDFGSDSPLSSVPSSPSMQRSETIRASISQDAEMLQLRQILAAETIARHAGRFRQRTAQQLHPYQMEQAKYLQQCKARGMRPVRVLGIAVPQEEAETSSQESETHSFVPSPSRFRDSTLPLQGLSREQTELLELQDFPDHDVQRPVMRGVAHSGTKRRRLNVSESPARSMRPSFDEYDVPMSPPSSPPEPLPVLPRKQNGPARFRFPSGMTPLAQLPTPEISSELRHVDTEEDDMDVLAASAKTPVRRAIDLTSSSPVESQREEPQNREHEVFTTQKRRIKGVLPASWLKLDLRAQQQRQPATNTSHTNDHNNINAALPSKGVAKRLTKTQRTTSAIMELSDDETNSEPDSPPHYRQQRLQFDNIENSAAFVDVDNMEHDFVDPLLARSSRREPSKPKNTYQPKIRDVLPHGTTIRQRDESERGPARARSAATTNAVRRQRAPPRLSIADVALPRPSSGGVHTVPQFVRVAARKARQTTHKARQSPTSKYVHLATRQDTSDALSTLRMWREGTIALVEPAALPATYGPTRMLPPSRKQTVQEAHRPQPRSVQLESVESSLSAISRAAAFSSRLEELTAKVRTQILRQVRGPVQHEARHGTEERPEVMHHARTARKHIQQAASRTQRRRKHAPTRIDIEQEQYEQPSPLVIDDASPNEICVEPTTTKIFDLSNVSTPYTTDFAVRPLAHSLSFSQNTLIGSGDFAQALKPITRPLHEPAGYIDIEMQDHTCSWSAWNETVKTELSQLGDVLIATAESSLSAPPEMIGSTQATIDYMLRSIVRYVTGCLYFHDPIDRQGCLDAFIGFCEQLLNTVVEQNLNGKLKTMILQYVLIIGVQQAKLSREAVSTITRGRTQAIVQLAARSLADILINSIQQEPDATLAYDGQLTVLVLHHVLQVSDTASSFWAIINDVLSTKFQATMKAHNNDQIWWILFKLSPVLMLDESGQLKQGITFRPLPEDWSLLKSTTKDILNVYDATYAAGSNINAYMRVLLGRSEALIKSWGWRKCEIWLALLYDFFVQRRLSLLCGEMSTGSPAFLDNLTAEPDLGILPDDNSFHMLLKLIASSIQAMSRHSVYAPKKLRSVVWRLVPGHSHDYRKDVDMSEDDLDRLRNHYDLLSTLYFAAPLDARLDITVLLNLVDYETSHRAACRLSVRAWSRLASFQASLAEPIERLHGFCEWFTKIIKATSTQHRLARSEAEEDFHKLRANNHIQISTAELDRVVAANQRHIAATLVDALAGLKRSIQSADTVQVVAYMMEQCHCWTQLIDFDITDKSLKGVFLEILELLQVCTQRLYRSSVTVRQQSDDSQDYGDDSALQAFAAGLDDVVDHAKELLSLLTPPLSKLISNMFGSEKSPDDSILARGVSVWMSLLVQLVKRGQLSWSEVLDGYGFASWRQLRDTSQHRSFTPNFLAAVVDTADDDTPIHLVLGSWLKALVVRESSLKHQHQLTSAMLNKWFADPVLLEMPYARNHITHKYDLTLYEIQQRRLLTLATVLNNMRKHVEDPDSASTRTEIRAGYALALREMMNAMKYNYAEVQGTADAIANANVQGEYVDFVQSIVALMQQHTTSICQIDRFFTDSAAFPLPAEDPTYVVGRLKAYSSKLNEEKTQKELAVFIVTVCERAVIDDQEQYLVNQLLLASGQDIEDEEKATTNLRRFLLSSIVPACLYSVQGHYLGWRLALPMMTFAIQALEGLLYQVSFSNRQGMQRISSMITRVVVALTDLVYTNIMPDREEVVSNHFVIRQGIIACTKTLALTEYLVRLKVDMRQAQYRLTWLMQHYAALRYIHPDGYDVNEFGPRVVRSSVRPEDGDHSSRWPEVTYIKRLIIDGLRKNWKVGNYMTFAPVAVRNGTTKMVSVPPPMQSREWTRTTEKFREVYQSMFSQNERRSSDEERRRARLATDGDCLVI